MKAALTRQERYAREQATEKLVQPMYLNDTLNGLHIELKNGETFQYADERERTERIRKATALAYLVSLYKEVQKLGGINHIKNQMAEKTAQNTLFQEVENSAVLTEKSQKNEPL